MTRAKQVEAFQKEIDGVCIRYLAEFDIQIEEMVGAMLCEAMLLMFNAAVTDLGDEK
jgi:hypothetical protein